MLDVDEIAALFKGDSETTGYAHEELVIELCSRTSKNTLPTVEWVWGILYPGVKREQVPIDVQNIIVSGVKLWYRRGSPRRLP